MNQRGTKMAMNRELIGRRYAASTYEVTEDAMVRYALATNEINPRLIQPGEEGQLIAAPVFPVVYHARVLGKPISDPELNIDFKRALHGEQDMTFHQPVRAGDIISTTPSIEGIQDKGTGETISVRLRSENQAGHLVEETLFTLFVRGRGPGPGPKGEGKPSKSTKLDLAVAPLGDPIATIEQKLDADQTFRYSEASGDKVRIHLDPEVARKAGFAGIIGHTFLTSLISLREEQYRMANHANHVVICGYTASARTLR